MSKRLTLPALLALALALIAVGCGSGEDSSSGTGGGGGETSSDQTASLSKAEFIKQADAVCSKGKKEVEAQFAAYLKKNKIEGIGAKGEPRPEAEERKADVVLTIGVPAYRKQLEEIDALPAPAGDEATVEEFVSAAEEGVEVVEEEPKAVFDGTSKAFAEADKVAKGYGFKVCGNN